MQFSLSLSMALLATIPAVFAAPATNVYIVESAVGQQNPQEHIKAGNEACLAVCMGAKPECPGKMEPKQFGDCWTCCIQFGEELSH